MTEPMTAAEYRRELICPNGWTTRILAALEEREALLGEREEWGKLSGQTIQDAAVGALVRRIREHPKSVAPVVHDGYGLDVFTVPVSEDGFRALLSHLDSLLPKEPEVVVGASGQKYRVDEGEVEVYQGVGFNGSFEWVECSGIPMIDAPVVAKLMEGRGNAK